MPDLVPSRFPTKIFYAFLIAAMLQTCADLASSVWSS